MGANTPASPSHKIPLLKALLVQECMCRLHPQALKHTCGLVSLQSDASTKEVIRSSVTSITPPQVALTG